MLAGAVRGVAAGTKNTRTQEYILSTAQTVSEEGGRERGREGGREQGRERRRERESECQNERGSEGGRAVREGGL